MSEKIRIAQIGVGHNHAVDKMIGLQKLPELFEIVGIVEEDEEWWRKRGNLEPYRNLPRLTMDEIFAMKDLHAVAVECDGPQLLPTALRCAERGLHLHMDKPGGQDLAGFRALVDLCKAQNLAFQLAYVYRYNPALQFMLKVCREGWIGKIFEIHAVMSRYDGDNSEYRKWLAQYKGGAMYIFAGYLLDIVLDLLGEPQKVHSFLKETRHDGLVDNGLAVLEYDIATATVRVSVEEVDGMKHRRVILCGTEGTLELCPIEHPGTLYYTEGLKVRMTLKHPHGQYTAGTHIVDCGPLGDRYTRQLEEFAAVLRGEKTNPWGYEHEYLLQKVLLEVCNAL